MKFNTAIFALFAAILLAACSDSGVSGKYVGTESFFFGMGQVMVQIDVDGNEATLILAATGSNPIKEKWKARVEGDLLVLTAGRNRLDFNIRDKGRLLQCIQCKSLSDGKMPDVYHRMET